MRIVLGFSLFFYSALSLASMPAKSAVYGLLLASSDLDDVKMGVRSIQQDQVKDTALLDLAAERLCLYVRAGDADKQGMDDSDNKEIVAALARILGSSGDAKYRPLLQLGAQTTDEDDNKKVFAGALAQLPAGSAAGTVTEACPSLGDIRAKALAGSVPAKPGVDAGAVSNRGTPLDDVLEKLGMPTAARHYQHRIYPSAEEHQDVEGIEISYLNGATMHFDYGVGWRLLDAIPNVKDPAADATGQDAALLDGVLSGEKDVVSDTADGIKDSGEFPVDVLDAAARRLWRMRDVETGDALDMAEDLAEFLGDSHNARYRTVLSQLGEKAKARKLRKQAGEALDDLTDDTAEQFQPPAD
jgi:hypothetical protein